MELVPAAKGEEKMEGDAPRLSPELLQDFMTFFDGTLELRRKKERHGSFSLSLLIMTFRNAGRALQPECGGEEKEEIMATSKRTVCC